MTRARTTDVDADKIASNVYVLGGGGGQKTAAASMPVVLAQGGALTDRSGTITTGGTRQASTAVLNTNRRYLYLENPTYKADGTTLNPVERLCFNLTGNATLGAGSICLDIGQSFEYAGVFVPTGAVDVDAATTGHAFMIWEG